MEKPIFLGILLFVTGCVSVTSESAANMTDQGLCDLVNSDRYITTFEEREIIYQELQNRSISCDFLNVVE
tara:strand:+ start:396998 stop:397207 length:210 start_codon:yes stop_codon:yes gene_type:complete